VVYLSFHKEDNLTLRIFYHLNNLSEMCSRSSAYVELGQITSNRRVPFLTMKYWKYRNDVEFDFIFLLILLRKKNPIRSKTSLRYLDEMQNFDIVYQDQANILFLLGSRGP